MGTITLNDGTVLNARCNPDRDFLFLYIYGLAVRAGLSLFLNEETIGRIVYKNYETEQVYEGYTDIYSFNSSAGNFNIVLRKGEQNAAA